MEQRTSPAGSGVTALGAGAIGRVAVVAGALLVLWTAIGGVLRWWG